MLFVAVILSQISLLYGAPGCIDLKKEFSDYKIGRKPTKNSEGTCSLQRTCCSLEVEGAVKNDTVKGLRRVVSKEIDEAKLTMNSVKDMTAVMMVEMMEELVPDDIKENIDLQKIGAAIWSYTLGEITAYNLTIEVAVIGSKLLFTEKAAQDLIDMTECIIRELGKHATDAFMQISTIVEDQLEAPKTFGDGFAVADILLSSIEQFELPEDCTYGEIVGCRRCGVKVPQVCSSTCKASANHCLANVYSQAALWSQWVESLTRLVDAMVLMKDIKIDPKTLVTPDLIEEVTQDIMSSMVNVNFMQCRGISKRSALPYNPELEGLRKKRQMSEGDLLKGLLSGFFSSYTLNRNSCKQSSSDTKCWLGHRVGNYKSSENNIPSRATKSYSPNSETEAAIELNNYVQRVDAVITKIHAKVREQRSRMSVPEGYTMYSGSTSLRPNSSFNFLALLLTAIFFRYRARYI